MPRANYWYDHPMLFRDRYDHPRQVVCGFWWGCCAENKFISKSCSPQFSPLRVWKFQNVVQIANLRQKCSVGVIFHFVSFGASMAKRFISAHLATVQNFPFSPQSQAHFLAPFLLSLHTTPNSFFPTLSTAPTLFPPFLFFCFFFWIFFLTDGNSSPNHHRLRRCR